MLMMDGFAGMLSKLSCHDSLKMSGTVIAVRACDENAFLKIIAFPSSACWLNQGVVFLKYPYAPIWFFVADSPITRIIVFLAFESYTDV
jgi:hypothetical protein